MINDQEICSPSSMTRDEDGRLVGLLFDSLPPLPAENDKLWLVALFPAVYILGIVVLSD